MSTYLQLQPPIYSPWGPTQTANEEIPGVWHVTTASHGGYILSHERNEQIPEAARSAEAAYEEDIRWAIPAIVFSDELLAANPQYPLERAHTILRNWQPDQYETVTGNTPTAENSHIVARRPAYQAAIGKRVVLAALKAPHQGIPVGHIRIRTVTLASYDNDSPRYADDSTTYLVTEDEYPGPSSLPILESSLTCLPDA